MRVQLSQSNPGQVITAQALNSNFDAFSGSLNADNFSTDCFETYHINHTDALSPTLYSAGLYYARFQNGITQQVRAMMKVR